MRPMTVSKERGGKALTSEKNTSKRMAAEDRRQSIMIAATSVFAKYGFNGAKTLEIARAANVSEALIFRHFPSKQALYRAVLRKLIADQNENFKQALVFEADTDGLIGMLAHYYQQCVYIQPGDREEKIKILFASLIGDGDYARLIYRRARRLLDKSYAAATAAARKAGDLVGPEIAMDDAFAFSDSVGAMIALSHAGGQSKIPYVQDKDKLLRDAIRFSARGIGVTDAAIERYFARHMN